MRRKAIPLGTKYLVLLRQALCPECSEPLGSKIEWDHRPSLAERKFDVATSLYTPDENDPGYLDALHVDCHKRRSFGTKATTTGSDAHRRAKVRRVNRAFDAHKKAMKSKGEEQESKPPSKWPKRKFGQ